MTKQRFSFSLAVFLGVVATGVAAESSLTATSACVPSGTHPKIVAKVTDPASIQSIRVYFHASGQSADYYVEMRKGGYGEAWALLPKPSSETTGIAYRVRATDESGREIFGSQSQLTVSATCVAPSLSPDETSFASNLVLGQTVDLQPTVPAGFSCDGILSLITAQGEMRSSLACRDRGPAGVKPGGAIKSPSGVAGGVVVRDNNSGATRPLSPSRP